MRILAINGSPRENSNTAVLLNAFLEGVKGSEVHTELINLSEKKIGYCHACDDCGKKENCNFDDDMSDLYGKLKDCDIIILGSPVYFGNVTGLMKNFIDRLRFAGKKRLLQDKIGAIAVCGKRAGHENTVFALFDVLTMLGVILPGNCFIEAFAGKTGEISNNEKMLEACKDLANRCLNFIN